MQKKCLIFLVVLLLAFIIFSWNRDSIQTRQKLQLQRAQDIATMWKTVSEMFTHFDALGGNEAWDRAFQKALQELPNCKDSYDYYILLEEMLANLQDGHAKVTRLIESPQEGAFYYIEGLPPPEHLQIGVLPFALKAISGRYIVAVVWEGCTIPLYSEITHINQQEIKSYLENEVGKLIGIQTQNARQQAMADRLYMGRKGKKLEISYIDPKGVRQSAKLRYGSKPKGALAVRATNEFGSEPIYESEDFKAYIMDDCFYLKVNSLARDTVVTEFYEKLIPLILSFDNEGYILDFRNCEGGYTSYGVQIMQAFVDKQIRDLAISYRITSSYEAMLAKQQSLNAGFLQGIPQNEILQRGRQMLNGTYLVNPLHPDLYGEAILKVMELESKNFPVESGHKNAEGSRVLANTCVILSDGSSYSASEGVVLLAQDAGVAVIGSTSRGTTGNTLTYPLSNGWCYMFTAGYSSGPNGETIWNKGVEPTVTCDLLYNDYVKGRDTQLFRAIDYIKQKDEEGRDTLNK